MIAMLCFGFVFSGLLPAFAQTAQTTLESIQARGEIRCGVSEGVPGFSVQNADGNWTGLDVDFCRALAAAIFNDPSKVDFVPLSPESRFAALVSGDVDVLSRNTTWTLAREASMGIQFAAVTYYDGQGFMVRKDLGVTSADELDGVSVCVQSGTTTEFNLADHFEANHANYSKLTMPNAAQALYAYSQGRCEVLTSDLGQLHASRAVLGTPDEHTILPEVIAKEPLGPAVRAADISWLTLVRWTHHAMVSAEELGVSSTNVDEMLNSGRSREVKRLLGTHAALGQALGLSNDWVARIVRHVGNYGESFARNLGAGSDLAIPRGLNRLWTQGGLQYAPPFR